MSQNFSKSNQYYREVGYSLINTMIFQFQAQQSRNKKVVDAKKDQLLDRKEQSPHQPSHGEPPIYTCPVNLKAKSIFYFNEISHKPYSGALFCGHLFCQEKMCLEEKITRISFSAQNSEKELKCDGGKEEN